MIDRGIIKWQPFNSCFNSNDIIKDISKKKEKDKNRLPILSEDQLIILEDKIKTAYYLKMKICLDYYYDGEIKNLWGTINHFDSLKKKIYINNHEVYFKQIIKIKEV